jgi:hypothetical protein
LKRKQIGIALLFGAVLEAVLIAADSSAWHPPMWTQMPGMFIRATLAVALHPDGALNAVVFFVVAC